MWGNTSKKYLDEILKLQKRALQLMYFKNCRHAIPLFVKSKILPIHMLYYETIGNLMHEINNISEPYKHLRIAKAFMVRQIASW